jgi:hypothetical protein
VYGLSKDERSVTPDFLVRPGRVGIEVELEGLYSVRSGRSTLTYWDIIHDDSLRDNGVEFVTKRDGLEGAEIIGAINELQNFLRSHSPKASWRCSDHVHVDIRDMTIQQCKRMILASVITENILYTTAGSHRKDSNFCMPVSGAEDMVRTLAVNWKREGPAFFDYLCMDWNKYSGMNLIPSRQLGTIEYRNSEPKYTRGQLLRLVNRYLALKQSALSFEGSDSDFINTFTTESVKVMFTGAVPSSFEIDPEDLTSGKNIAFDIINLGTVFTEEDDLVRESVRGVMFGVQDTQRARDNVNHYLSHENTQLYFSEVRRLREHLGLSTFRTVVTPAARTAYERLIVANPSLLVINF